MIERKRGSQAWTAETRLGAFSTLQPRTAADANALVEASAVEAPTAWTKTNDRRTSRERIMMAPFNVERLLAIVEDAPFNVVWRARRVERLIL